MIKQGTRPGKLRAGLPAIRRKTNSIHFQKERI